MRSPSEVLMDLVQSGLSAAQSSLVLELAALVTAAGKDPSRAAKSARNARYYRSRKLSSDDPATDSATETRLIQTPEKRLKTSESVLIQPALAHVRDKPLPSEITGTDTSEPNGSSVRVLAIAKPNGFARFWENYPVKVGKRDAEKAYGRALKRITGPDPPAVILAGVARAKTSRKWREGYVPNPATWLNRDSWDDEPEMDQTHERPHQQSAKFAARQANLERSLAGFEIAAGRGGRD